MRFKIRIEIEEESDAEIIIRCPEINDRILALQKQLSNMGMIHEIPLTLNGCEYFVELSEILFFETNGNHTCAHTRDAMYYTELKLFELLELLPRTFVRASKSSIVNIKNINFIKRDLSGVAEVGFNKTEKKIFVSRMYYKAFRQAVDDFRQ